MKICKSRIGGVGGGVLILCATWLGISPALLAAEKPVQRSAAGASPCPATTFENFAQIFFANLAVQRAYTHAPLKYEHVVDAQPEPKTVTEFQSRAKIKFPVAPLPAAQKSRGLMKTIRGPATKSPVVKLENPDTDYVIYYKFQRGDCWNLVSIDDQSL